jgi:hypothetical protein
MFCGTMVAKHKAREIMFTSAGDRTPVVQLIFRPYIDRATPAPKFVHHESRIHISPLSSQTFFFIGLLAEIPGVARDSR